MRWKLAPAFLLVVLGRPTPAHACSTPGLFPYRIDPALAATDQTLPILATPMVASITRGKGPERQGCTYSGSSCDGIGTIALTNLATDDRTLADQIGYRFSVVGGRLPDGFTLPTETVSVAISEGTMWLHWGDGETDDQESIDFTLQIVAVDEAGNESAPQTVRILDDTGGCRIAGRRSASGGATIALALAAMGVAARRRRRGGR